MGCLGMITLHSHMQHESYDKTREHYKELIRKYGLQYEYPYNFARPLPLNLFKVSL